MRNQDGRAILALLAAFAAAMLPAAVAPLATMLAAQRLALLPEVLYGFQTAFTSGLVLGALPAAALAARFGDKRVLLAAVAGLAALAPALALPLDFVPLVGLRVLQGVLSAAVPVAGLALLRRLRGDERLGFRIAAAAAAAVAGLVLAQAVLGILYAALGPAGVVVPSILLAVPALVLGRSVLPRSTAPGLRLDILGLVLATLGLFLFLGFLQSLPEALLRALILLVLAVVVLALLLWQQWTREAPLLPLDLLARPGVGAMVGAALFAAFAVAASTPGLILRLGEAWGLRSAWPGPWSLPLLITAALVGLVAGRAGSPRMALAGASALALGLAAVALLPPDPAFGAAATGVLILALVAQQIGPAVFEIGNRLESLRASPPARSPAAVALLVLAGGLGTILAPVALRLLVTDNNPAGVDALFWLWLAAAAALLAALLSLAAPRRRRAGG